MLIRRQEEGQELENVLTKAETKLTNAKTLLTNEQNRAISIELAQEWERLSNELEQIGTEVHRNAINEFTAKVNAELGQGNLELRKLELGANVVNGLLKSGNKTPKKRHKEEYNDGQGGKTSTEIFEY